MSNVGSQFSCDDCGKQYSWKPAIAGKRAKCACGSIVDVPSSDPATAEQDMYDLAEPPPSAVIPVAARPAPVLSYGAGDEPAIDSARYSFDTIYHKPRDFYWPTALLVLGTVALLAWAASRSSGSLGVVVVYSVYFSVATIFKTIMLIGAAFIIAPMAGVSFGGFWTTVLKLAAIVVVTDAALFWLQSIMEATGAYPSGGGGRSWMGVATVNTLLAVALIGVMLRVMFDMDREDVAGVALPLAIINRVLNFIILLALAALLAPARAPAVPRTAAPAPARAAPASAPAASRPLSAKDATIAQRMKPDRQIREARGFYEQIATTTPRYKELVERLYGLGAKRVMFLTAAGRRGIELRTMFVELPSEQVQRNAIARIFSDYPVISDSAGAIATSIEQGDQYLEIPLAQ